MDIKCNAKCDKCSESDLCRNTYYEKYLFEPFSHAILKSTDLDEFIIIPFPRELVLNDPLGKKLLNLLITFYILKKQDIVISTHTLVQSLHWDLKTVKEMMNELVKRKYIIRKDMTSRTSYFHFTDKMNRPDYVYVVDYYFKRFREKFGGKPIFRNLDGEVFKRLLKQYNPEILCKLIDAYWETKNDFIISTGYSLKFLEDQVNSLFINLSKRKEFVQEISDWQLKEYLKSKQENKLEGFTKDVIETYEREIKRRNITLDEK